MSHEITVRESGFAEAAFALTPAWHGLGAVLDHPMSSAEALNVAGLDWTEYRATAIEKTRLAVRDSWNSPCQMLPGIERTAWAAFNSITEHIDHLPRRGATIEQKAEARFNVCLYGAGRDMKKRALLAACRFAGVNAAAV